MSDFANGGLVDFALDVEPQHRRVVGYNDQLIKKKYMSYFKFGEGPLYMFYTPYHLPHMQLPHSVARAVLFKDPTLTPMGAPVCDTMAMAKRDLKSGEKLDGMGGFTCYGLIDSYDNCQRGDTLPIALSGGCRLKRDIPKDQPVSYRDVELPAGRLCDTLRAEQTAHFATALRATA